MNFSSFLLVLDLVLFLVSRAEIDSRVLIFDFLVDIVLLNFRTFLGSSLLVLSSFLGNLGLEATFLNLFVIYII